MLAISISILMKAKNKAKKEKTKKQKTVMWTVVVFTAINFLIVLGFFIYLYFWLKARG